MSIVENKKAFFDYYIEEQWEAGIVLEGWETKAIRAGRANIKESYVKISNGKLVLFGAHISPLATASTHITTDPIRTRTLLLHKKEINKIIGLVERSGYTLLPLNLHYCRGRIKLQIGLGKGKKSHDKRAVQKENDSKREAQSAMKQNSR